jgi:tetratricopeptide (TPR) repeat protein
MSRSRARHGFLCCACLSLFLAGIAAYAQNQEPLGDVVKRIRALKAPPGGWPPPLMEKGLTPDWQGTPISKMTVLAWAAAGLAPADAAREIHSRGIDFAVDESFTALAKSAGAEAMLSSLQAATLHATAGPEPAADRLASLSEAGAATHRRDYDAALKLVVAELRLDPKNADLLFAAGSLLIERGNPGPAAMLLVQSVEANTKFPYAHGRLAYAYYQMGAGADAQREALFMTNLVPDSADSYKYLGLAYEAQGGYGLALRQYDKALAIDPDNSAVYFDIGIARAGMNDLNGAVEAYQHSARIDGTRPSLFNNLGIVLGKLGRVDEAVTAFERAKKIDPAAPQIRQSYGAMLCNAGRYEAAVVEFTALLKMDPEWNMARPCLAKSLARLGRTEESEKVKADYTRYEAGGSER